jgi:hypothetical protein
MAPDLLSAPDKVALPGLSLAFPFGEPLLLPIKTVLVDLFRYCSSERAAEHPFLLASLVPVG